MMYVWYGMESNGSGLIKEWEKNWKKSDGNHKFTIRKGICSTKNWKESIRVINQVSLLKY